MTAQALPIKSTRDLWPLSEVYTEEDDEDGNPKFLFSTFGFITEDHVAYFGESKLRKFQLTQKDIIEALKLLPDEDVYPVAPPNITVFSTPLNSSVFMKGPGLNTVFTGTGVLPKLILQEVEIMELLTRNPHPHIVRYHGCLIRRSRIVGLVFDRYPDTLWHRLEKGAQGFNIEDCMSKITSAVHHLHSLGLAHNDLMPSNIMVDGDDIPVVIDYGSCQPFGNLLISTGTPGWVDEYFTHSAQKNDEIALGKIRIWLESKRGQD
ncbi:serine/threonine-protein kinase-like protein [Patellaria atrata CBS 101060]|uniref:Serine/threonine-protein kinase-like protein n=1 Tax=Patellaria atrata CBS 101060 TaxID=1346257 RepID=A0A9P4SFT0_9PEZI|nr:serine/threonine-protein kinase-like protein [Patellaria atrata CBS 101060]